MKKPCNTIYIDVTQVSDAWRKQNILIHFGKYYLTILQDLIPQDAQNIPNKNGGSTQNGLVNRNFKKDAYHALAWIVLPDFKHINMYNI